MKMRVHLEAEESLNMTDTIGIQVRLILYLKSVNGMSKKNQTNSSGILVKLFISIVFERGVKRSSGSEELSTKI